MACRTKHNGRGPRQDGCDCVQGVSAMVVVAPLTREATHLCKVYFGLSVLLMAGRRQHDLRCIGNRECKQQAGPAPGVRMQCPLLASQPAPAGGQPTVARALVCGQGRLASRCRGQHRAACLLCPKRAEASRCPRAICSGISPGRPTQDVGLQPMPAGRKAIMAGEESGESARRHLHCNWAVMPHTAEHSAKTAHTCTDSPIRECAVSTSYAARLKQSSDARWQHQNAATRPGHTLATSTKLGARQSWSGGPSHAAFQVAQAAQTYEATQFNAQLLDAQLLPAERRGWRDAARTVVHQPACHTARAGMLHQGPRTTPGVAHRRGPGECS
jgi:hypothetical protein